MYRGTEHALDEHDRAVGAILIGEALADACERAASLAERDVVAEPERWRAMAELHDTYPEIWRHLDRARRVLSSRGFNTAGYDDLRPHVRRAATENGPAIDHAALDDAKRAIDELKLVLPGTDWDGIAARTAGLVSAPLVRRRRQRMVVAGVCLAFGGAVFGWLSAIVPVHKTPPAEVMRQELAEIREERKEKIQVLQAEIGDRCDPARVHELMKLLVLDGRGPEATAFGDRYQDRCGEDIVVEHWANAPRPHH